MTTQTLGALASDQKIDKVFHIFGHSIPVGKDGRRMWPTKFKREMAQQMISGKLSAREVQKACRVSKNTAYKWKNEFSENGTKLSPVAGPKAQVFSEIRVAHDQLEKPRPTEQITLKHGDCELCLPSGYPVTQLAQLICALDAKT